MKKEDVNEEGARSDDAENGHSQDSGRVRLETLIPGLVKKAITQGVEVLSDERLREKVVAEVVKKAIDKGGEVVDVTEDSIRKVLGELQTGRELTERVLGRVDELKEEATKAVGEELSKFLAQIELSKEVQKVLNGMVLDIRTEVRFKQSTEDESDPS